MKHRHVRYGLSDGKPLYIPFRRMLQLAREARRRKVSLREYLELGMDLELTKKKSCQH